MLIIKTPMIKKQCYLFCKIPLHILPALECWRNSALIHSGLEIISTDQRCFSSNSTLYFTWKSLISAGNWILQSSKISTEQCWFLSDSQHLQFIFQFFFELFPCTSDLEAQNSDFHRTLRKEVNNNKLFVQSSLKP